MHLDKEIDVRYELQKVLVMNGIFNTKLPDDNVSNPIAEALKKGVIYLCVAVDGDAEMTPRQVITSVPFSLSSADSDMLDGRTGRCC